MPALDRLTDANALARIREHDATLFGDDTAVQAQAAERLGWTDLATTSHEQLGQALAVAQYFREMGIGDVVLLGMGGSSLAALTMATIFGDEATGARLHVVDTTSPVTVKHLMDTLQPQYTAFFVSSKSGGTIEPNSLYAVFRAWMDDAVGDGAGAHFVAITDPGSSLEALAREDGFHATLLTPADVGGRFSALTLFGLAPAAAAGIDIGSLLNEAVDMHEAILQVSPRDNPALKLAAWLADSQSVGCDKLTLITSPALRSFGLWVEQLVAESTGKDGTGMVPVVDLAQVNEAGGFGHDRALVVVRYEDDVELAHWTIAQGGQRPIFDIVAYDPTDLGAEFVRWEYAIALLGYLLGINPFDEPNVAEAKAATAAVLEGTSTPPAPSGSPDGFALTFGGSLPSGESGSLEAALRSALGMLADTSYLAVLAYLPDDPERFAELEAVVPAVSIATDRAVTLELGPRYLHSTGQLHKGGPASGTFVVVTARADVDIPVPGKPYTLGELFRAQAVGDFITLAAHARPVLWVELPDSSPATVRRFAEALKAAAGA